MKKKITRYKNNWSTVFVSEFSYITYLQRVYSTVPFRSIRQSQGMLRVTCLPKWKFRHLAELTVTFPFFGIFRAFSGFFKSFSPPFPRWFWHIARKKIVEWPLHALHFGNFGGTVTALLPNWPKWYLSTVCPDRCALSIWGFSGFC